MARRTRAVAVRRRSSFSFSRRRSGRSRFGSGKLSVAMLAGTLVGFINAYKVGTYAAADSPNQYMQRLLLFYTGFAPWNPPGAKWQLQETRFGLAPLLTGVIVHFIANKTGLNRGVSRLTGSIPVQI